MALSTKRALADSLQRLLTKHTLDKITVKDIVEDCGVNRQTFYYHFHDVYDLLEWIFQDRIDTMLADREDYDDWMCGIDHIVTLMLENRRLILNAYHSVSHEAVSDFIKQWLKPFMRKIVERESEGLTVSEEDQEFVAGLFTLGITGFFTEWVEHRMAESDLKNLEKLKMALDGSAHSILMRFSET